MLKNICSLGLLAAFAMIPGAAHAQTIQSNQQNAVQNGAATGAFSNVNQTLDQSNFQDAYGTSGYFGAPEVQHSVQNGVQNGAAVGPYSNVNQTLDQYNSQSTSDYSPYSPYSPGGYAPSAPEVQSSVQNGAQSGAAVGAFSNVDQHLDQTNIQDASSYIPPFILY
jgi:hypothetical protein